MRRPPRFWSAEPGRSLAARALEPLGRAYNAAVQARLSGTGGEKAPCPVVCIGNATLGGVGKTPFTRLIGETLLARGRHPHVLTRGYGGTERGPHRVMATDTAARVGDEPLLLAGTLPVWVGRDRPAGARAAAAAGAELVLMDDGFQNPSLSKDLSFLLVDGSTLFGNGAVFPAGPLRELPEAAASRAGALVAMMEGPEAAVPDTILELAGDKPVYRAWFRLDASTIPKGPLLAFCGIGRPERFYGSLAEAGANPLSTRSFPDHHRFSAADLRSLRAEAERDGLRLVTTEKDLMRLAPEERHGITAIRGAAEADDLDGILRMIEELL